jgi:hypothetical protein
LVSSGIGGEGWAGVDVGRQSRSRVVRGEDREAGDERASEAMRGCVILSSEMELSERYACGARV